MRSQAKRDEQTLTIAATLAIFVGALLVGLVPLGLVSLTFDVSEGVGQVLTFATFIAAASTSGWYLVRHR